jgi:hypothetical protein
MHFSKVMIMESNKTDYTYYLEFLEDFFHAFQKTALSRCENSEASRYCPNADSESSEESSDILEKNIEMGVFSATMLATPT